MRRRSPAWRPPITTFGRGAFAGSGPESGSELAVIPLFNTSQEILGEGTYINTTKGVAIPTVKHTTTVTFAQPVDPAAVRESALNAFIVVNQKSSGTFTREKEIHIPGRKRRNSRSYRATPSWSRIPTAISSPRATV